MFTCVFIWHRINPLLGTKLSIYLGRSLFFCLVPQFGRSVRNDYVAAFSTALRSATAEIEMGGYKTVPCSSTKTQRNSEAVWLKL